MLHVHVIVCINFSERFNEGMKPKLYAAVFYSLVFHRRSNAAVVSDVKSVCESHKELNPVVIDWPKSKTGKIIGGCFVDHIVVG